MSPESKQPPDELAPNCSQPQQQKPSESTAAVKSKDSEEQLFESQSEDVGMVSVVMPAGDSPAAEESASAGETASGPLDFSFRRNDDVLDLTAKYEHRPSSTDSSPLDLSVPRAKRHQNIPRAHELNKTRKLGPHNPPVPKSPWGHVSRPENFWDGHRSLQQQQQQQHQPGLDGNYGAPNRPSIWQSQWLNKGEITKDVLKCVWCKESFGTLTELTVHMKKSPRCGVSVPRMGSPATSAPSALSKIPNNSHSNSPISGGSSSLNDLNLLIKETMPLPRKLVRGQDVWLGKGAEQTKQILKCMWCGQSFRSLADMTTHMRQTQHYTNIISQEQLISWKSPDDKVVSGAGTTGGGGVCATGPGSNPAVNAVLTCKVCDQAFSSLKELSSHMGKNAHYQEHLFKAISEGGSRRRPVREKRKKALPVKKLLEMERSQYKGSSPVLDNDVRAMSQNRPGSGGRITCEKCSVKIDTSTFVDHIRTCVGISSGSQGKNISGRDEASTPTTGGSDRSESPAAKTADEQRGSPEASATPTKNTKNPSVLNAIERLIEKSFDSASAKPNVTSAFILRKMGFDENAFETRTKSPVDRLERGPTGPRRMLSSGRSDVSSDEQEENETMQRLKARPEMSSSDNSAGHRVKVARDKIMNRRRKRKRERPGVSSASSKALDEGGGEEQNKRLSVPPPGDKVKQSPSAIGEKNESIKDRCDKDEETGSLLSDVNVDPTCDYNRSDGAVSADDEQFVSDESGNKVENKPKVTVSRRRHRARHEHHRHSRHNGRVTTGTTVSSSPSPPASAPRCSDHPLKQLQRLLDKTDAQLFSKRSAAAAAAAAAAQGNYNKMLAGSANHYIGGSSGSPFLPTLGWAYNDALAYDSIGRNPSELSYGSFTPPPGIRPEQLVNGSPSKTGSPDRPAKFASSSSTLTTVTTSNANNNNSKHHHNINNNNSSASAGTTNGNKDDGPNSTKIYDESPHSKFLKYSELARQLSSK